MYQEQLPQGSYFLCELRCSLSFSERIGEKREYITKSYSPIFQVKAKNTVQVAKGLGMSLYYFCILLIINTFFAENECVLWTSISMFFHPWHTIFLFQCTFDNHMFWILLIFSFVHWTQCTLQFIYPWLGTWY